MGRIGHTGYTQGLYLPCTLDGRPIHHQSIICDVTPLQRVIQTPSLPKGHSKHQVKSQLPARLHQKATSGQPPLRSLSNLRERNKQWRHQWKMTTWTWLSPEEFLWTLLVDYFATKDTQITMQHTINSEETISIHLPNIFSSQEVAKQKSSKMTGADNWHHGEIQWCCYIETVAPGSSVPITVMLTTSTGSTATNCPTMVKYWDHRRQLV